MTAYKRLTLYERQKIKEGLDQSLSFRCIAELIGRTASTISREVKANRVRKDNEISVAYKDKVPVSPSTIYRMVNAGVADCKNIYLERKVGFKPRHHSSTKSSTSHDKARRYAAFLTLSKDRRNLSN